jgi:hypothetical protein
MNIGYAYVNQFLARFRTARQPAAAPCRVTCAVPPAPVLIQLMQDYEYSDFVYNMNAQAIVVIAEKHT